jgi:hypothetical protein
MKSRIEERTLRVILSNLFWFILVASTFLI